jgi:transposase
MSAVKPRLLYANRCQGEFRDESMEQLLPPDHPVREIWQFVETLDLSALLRQIRSVPGQAGAPAIDPRILVALWLWATSEGVGSARALDELCRNHLVYRWLCGGVPVSYHTLSDFRTDHGEVLDQLLTQSVAVLTHEGLIDLKRVAQDGMRVRAAAGSSSFRRPATIAECLKEASEQVDALRSQTDEDSGAASRRQQAAQRRAAADRVARLQAAQAEFAALQEANAQKRSKDQRDPAELRSSTTDAQCRKMKMPDGGFRPGYNVQFATTTEGGAIVGVAVTNAGTDNEQMEPMRAQIEERTGVKPTEVLVDGGYRNMEAFDRVEQDGTSVYSPIKNEKEQLECGENPYARERKDTDATANWRARMGTPEAKAIYQLRSSTAEWANAQARNRGLYAVTVRGQPKVLAVVLWFALTHNVRRIIALRVAGPGDNPRRPGETLG